MNPHPSITPKLLTLKSWTKVRKYLKLLGCTRGEQNEVLDKLGIKDKLL